MALIVQMMCTECKHSTSIIQGSFTYMDNMCDQCFNIKRNTQKRDAMTALKLLSDEDRITRIEEWMYDQQHNLHTNSLTFK